MRSSANQVVIDVVCAFEVIACKYPGSTRVSTGVSLTNFALCMQTKVGVIAFCLTFVQTVFAQLAATNLSNTRYNYTVASWLAETAF